MISTEDNVTDNTVLTTDDEAIKQNVSNEHHSERCWFINVQLWDQEENPETNRRNLQKMINTTVPKHINKEKEQRREGKREKEPKK